MNVSNVVVHRLTSLNDLEAASRLYHEVFSYTDPTYAVSPRLLQAMSDNGGSVIGASLPDDRLVGFAFGFIGKGSDGALHHYSQAAVIVRDMQGSGLGRQLKYAQREVALENGIDVMRWAYDPMLSRNGHFNLDILGARGIVFVRDYYKSAGTDRLIVEWNLHGSRTDDLGEELHFVTVPATDTAVMPAHRSAIAAQIEELIALGCVATSCIKIGDEARYTFRRLIG